MFDITQLIERPDRLVRPAVFAHRGASRLFHENTLEAFDAAIGAGVDGIELDVRRTREGVLVVHHNMRVLRSSRWIKNLDYDDVQRLAKRRGYQVPTLEETLRLCSGKVALDVELKEGGYEGEVVEMVRRHYHLRQVVFTSFHGRVVSALRAVTPRANVGWILGMMAPGALEGRLRRGTLLGRAREFGANYLAPNWHQTTTRFLARAREAHLPLIVWTVNNRLVARRLVRQGVAVLVTDVPEWIVPVVREAGDGRR